MDKNMSFEKYSSSDRIASHSRMSWQTSDPSNDLKAYNSTQAVMQYPHSPGKSLNNRVKFEEGSSYKSSGRRRRKPKNETEGEDRRSSRSRSRSRRRHRSGSREGKRKKRRRKKRRRSQLEYFPVPGQKDPVQGRSVSFSIDSESQDMCRAKTVPVQPSRNYERPDKNERSSSVAPHFADIIMEGGSSRPQICRAKTLIAQKEKKPSFTKSKSMPDVRYDKSIVPQKYTSNFDLSNLDLYE